MSSFFTFLDQYRGGIFVLLVCIAFTILMIQWVTWIFRLGRFKQPGRESLLRERPTQFVFGQFLAEVINDFRNLLAVVIVFVFAFILAYAMVRSSSMDDMKNSLQAVMSTLGGLVGSIVGYYFGETAASRRGERGGREPSVSEKSSAQIQNAAGKAADEIEEAPRASRVRSRASDKKNPAENAKDV